MTNFSQKDPRWSDMSIGYSSEKCKDVGCVVTALAILTDETPQYVNWTLQSNQGFKSGTALVIWQTAAEVLGLDYDPATDHVVKYPCIAETDKFLPKSYHFFVMLDEKTIVDPLDGQTKENPYNIISYLNLSPKVSAERNVMLADPGVIVESLGGELKLPNGDDVVVARKVSSDNSQQVDAVDGTGAYFPKGWTGTVSSADFSPAGHSDDGNWYLISYGNNRGWMKARYLKAIPAKTSPSGDVDTFKQKLIQFINSN